MSSGPYGTSRSVAIDQGFGTECFQGKGHCADIQLGAACLTAAVTVNVIDTQSGYISIGLSIGIDSQWQMCISGVGRWKAC